jgi:GTP-binding protein
MLFGNNMPQNVFKNSSFVKSIVSLDQAPELKYDEIAFVGRSNVGKSSLLNALLGRKNLAKTSSTPGKTQLINYFLVDNERYFVDLPGYGFAKVAKKELKKWQKMIEGYLLKSEPLKLIVLLIDSRHTLMASDQQMIDWLDLNEMPYMVVLTKADKLKKNQKLKIFNSWKNDLPDHHLMMFSKMDQESIYQLATFLKNFISQY